MRVLQINAVYGFGSTGRNVQEMHEYFSDHGIESFVACAMFQHQIPVNGYKIGNLLDRKVHAFLSRVFDLQGYYSKIATRRFISYIEYIQPDVVHLHNFHSNYLCLPMLLKYLSKHSIATAVTLHDCFPFTGKCFHFSHCEQWKDSSCLNCQKKDNIPPTYKFFNQANKMFEDKFKLWSSIHRLGVIGVSDWITLCASQSMLSNAYELKRIYNWINTKIFYRRDNCHHFDNIRKKIIISSAMTWSKEKGIFDLIRLAERLGDDYHIVLVGKCNSVDLPYNMTIIGRINDVNELAELYSSANIFINASELETFGKVTIEAMACGLPVVVYDTTGCTELVKYGNGIIVPLHDLDALERAVYELVSRVNSVRFIDNEFTLENSCLEHIKLYRHLSVSR